MPDTLAVDLLDLLQRASLNMPTPKWGPLRVVVYGQFLNDYSGAQTYERGRYYCVTRTGIEPIFGPLLQAGE